MWNVLPSRQIGQDTDGNMARMRFAYWIPKARDRHTLRIFKTCCFSTKTMAAQTTWGLFHSTIFFSHIISYEHDFRKQVTEQKMCVLIFSTTFA
jgi:hypothetical protein